MRIALIGNEYYQQFPLVSHGGIESSVESTAWGLHRKDADFFCVVPRRKRGRYPYPFEIMETSFRPASVSRKKPGEFMREVASILEIERPDVIWSQSHWSVAPLLHLDTPVLATFQDSCLKQPGWMIDHPNAFYRFVSSFQHRNWVKEDWERERSFQVYTGLVDEEFEMATAREDYYLWVAALSWGWQKKGLDLFLELARRNPDKRFVAYGTGSAWIAWRLNRKARTLRNFEFRGELKRGPQHRDAFKKAKAFIMPTRIPEALGRTAIESLSKGTPVIGSAKGALPEIVPPGCGVTSDEVEVLHEALEKVFNEKTCFEYSKKFHVANEVARLMEISGQILQ